ncbi:MAG TPA: DUF5343 domain-containing protein [bacterium]|jgi:hypothetical protein
MTQLQRANLWFALCIYKKVFKMPENLPYTTNAGTLLKMLEKIQTAAVPMKFTTEFLENTLLMKGGTARGLMPFLKKIGLLKGDGTPTELYSRFRNPSSSGHALGEAMRRAYPQVFNINEKAHQLGDEDLRGIIMQITGLEKDNRIVGAIHTTFKTLRSKASFSNEPLPPASSNGSQSIQPSVLNGHEEESGQELPLNFSYTITLNLPATSDINVFNAIFKSLKEHLLSR